MRRIVLAFYVLLTLVSASSAMAAVPGATLPFTREENADGAKWVWFIFQRAGFGYDYACTKDFPASPHFARVDAAQPGDVAWWPDYVAIFFIEDGKPSYLTAEKWLDASAFDASQGKPLFFRYIKTAKEPS